MKVNYSGNYEGCFVCGKRNHAGLKLDFFYDREEEEVYTVWKPEHYMQGFEDIVHGGFISMLLDEVMAKVCIFNNTPAVTVKIEVRFKKPVYVNEEVIIRGKSLEVRGKRIKLKARCMDRNGEERALATGLFLGI